MDHGVELKWKMELFYKTNDGANLSVMCRRSQTREENWVETGGFSSEPQPHHVPLWTEMCDATAYSSLEVYMSSHMNYVFNITSKPERKIEKEPSTPFFPHLIFTRFNSCWTSIYILRWRSRLFLLQTTFQLTHHNFDEPFSQIIPEMVVGLGL